MSLAIALGIVGTALAARLGDAYGAAFALCSQLVAMSFVLFRLIGAGASVVVSQALAGGQRDESARAACATLGAGAWIGGAGMRLAAPGGNPLLRLMNAPPVVLPLAVPRLQCLAPVVLLHAWNNTLAGMLRSQLPRRPTTVVNLVIPLVHRLVRRLLARGLAISALVAPTAALAWPWLLGWLRPDPQSIPTGATLWWITLVLETGRTFNRVLANALRAAGDARYPLLVGAGLLSWRR